jgi:hypothetical protein
MKKSILEQLKAYGIAAAHSTGRYVDMVNHVPVKVVLAVPTYMKKDKLRKGDKIAIQDRDEDVAWICTVSKAEASLTGSQVLSLAHARKIKLE